MEKLIGLAKHREKNPKSGDIVVYVNSSATTHTRPGRKHLFKVLQVDENRVGLSSLHNGDTFTTPNKRVVKVSEVLRRLGAEYLHRLLAPESWEYVEINFIVPRIKINDRTSLDPWTLEHKPKNDYEHYVRQRIEDECARLDKLKRSKKDSYNKERLDFAEVSAIKSETKPENGDKNMMNKMIDRNANVARSGARIAAGTALNKIAKNKLKAHVPMYAKGYLDSALAEVVIANLARVAVDNFAASNANANKAADVMMEAAMVNFIGSFDLAGFLDSFLKEAGTSLDNVDDTKE